MKRVQITVFILLLLQAISLDAQDIDWDIQQVPFEGTKSGRNMEAVQDTSGRIWILGIDKWFNTNGEKIIEVPKPYSDDKDILIRGIYSVSDDGYFFLGGDSLRVYNPYSRKIIQSIGISEDFDRKGSRPYLFNTVLGDNQNIWAGFAPIGLMD
ncbi:MAG: hypothetical protein AAF705_06345, partial [Bacteroidota bacterium]